MPVGTATKLKPPSLNKIHYIIYPACDRFVSRAPAMGRVIVPN